MSTMAYEIIIAIIQFALIPAFAVCLAATVINLILLFQQNRQARAVRADSDATAT